MRVIVLDDAAPGQSIRIAGKPQPWHATWRGESPAVAGSSYDVEVEISNPEVVPSDTRTTGLTDIGIYSTDLRIVIRGILSDPFEDGIRVLNFGDGKILIDPEDISADIPSGQPVDLSVETVELFPQNF